MCGLVHIWRHLLQTRPHLAHLFKSDLLLIIIHRTTEAHVQLVCDLRCSGIFYEWGVWSPALLEFHVVGFEMVIILFISRATSSLWSFGRLRNSLLEKIEGWIIRRSHVCVNELWRRLLRNLIIDLSTSHLLASGSELGLIFLNLTVSNMIILCPFGPCFWSICRHLGVTEWEKLVWWFLLRRRKVLWWEELFKVTVLILGHWHTFFNELGFSLLLRNVIRSFLSLLFWVIKSTHLDLISKWVLFQFYIDPIKPSKRISAKPFMIKVVLSLLLFFFGFYLIFFLLNLSQIFEVERLLFLLSSFLIQKYVDPFLLII